MADDQIDNKAVQEALKKLSKGAESTASALFGTAQTFMFTKPGLQDAVKNIPVLGKTAGGVAKILEGQVSQYQALTKSGANFGGNLAQITLSATAAGLSLKEMTGLVAGNSELLAGFGDTVDSGMSSFLKNMTTMRQASSQYGMQLRNIGLTHEEIGEAMLMAQRMAMMSGAKDAQNASVIREKTAQYAKDLDILAKLTGKNADELKKSQAGLAREGDFRAKTLGMMPDMQNALKMAASQADASGIGALFKDMMIRGFPSADQAALAGMFGNSMAVMEQMKAAQDAGNVKEFERLKTTLSAAVIQDKLANKELAVLGSRTKATTALTEAYTNTSNQELAVMAKVTSGQIKLQDAQAEIDRMRKKALDEQKKQGGEAKPGDAVPADRMVLDAALRGQEAMIEAAVKVQAEVTERLYNEFMGPIFQQIGSSDVMANVKKQANVGMDAVGGVLTAVSPGLNMGTPGGTQANVDNLVSKLNVFIANEETSREQRVKASEISSNLQDALQGNDKTRLEQALKDANQLLGIVSEPQNKGSNQIIPKEGVAFSQAGGTPGLNQAMAGFKSFASMTQDFGKQSLGFLHGKELVMTEEQAKQLDAGIQTLAQQAGLALEGFDPSKIFDQSTIKTLSSKMEGISTGLGSTPNLPTTGLGDSNITNASANRQGAINTIKSKDGLGMGTDMTEKLSAVLKESGGQMNKMFENLSANMPKAEVFDGLLETSKQQLGSTMQQVQKMDAGNKLTKKLSKAGNAFGNVGL